MLTSLLRRPLWHLLLVMPERNFTRTPAAERETLRHMVRTFRGGLQIVRRRGVVRSFFVVSLVVGLSSEAFDRLWTVRILRDFRLPDFLGTDSPVVWFTIFGLVGTAVSLISSLVVNKVSPARVNSLHPNGILALLAAVQVGGVIGLAVLGNLWLALGAMWVQAAAVAVAWPIQAAWLNRNVDSPVRATMLSMDGQVNALGQLIGGPPLGALANRTSVTVALVASATILCPAVLIYARLRRIRLWRHRTPWPPVFCDRDVLSTESVGLRTSRSRPVAGRPRNSAGPPLAKRAG